MKPDRELGFLSFMAAVVPSVFITSMILPLTMDWIISILGHNPLLLRAALVTAGILGLVLAFVLIGLLSRIFLLFRWSRH